MTPEWLNRLLTVPCLIYQRIAQGTDEYGNPIYIELDPTPSTCLIQPASQDEIDGGRAEVNQYLVYLPASAVGLIDGFARIEVNATSYEAVESPAIYTSLTDPTVHHIEVLVGRGTA